MLAGHLPDIYALRAQALDGPVTAMDFARILLHLMQRRGFRSNRKADDAQRRKAAAKPLTPTRSA